MGAADGAFVLNNDMEKYLNEKHGKVQETEQTVEVKQEVSETPFKKESVSVGSKKSRFCKAF